MDEGGGGGGLGKALQRQSIYLSGGNPSKIKMSPHTNWKGFHSEKKLFVYFAFELNENFINEKHH